MGPVTNQKVSGISITEYPPIVRARGLSETFIGEDSVLFSGVFSDILSERGFINDYPNESLDDILREMPDDGTDARDWFRGLSESRSEHRPLPDVYFIDTFGRNDIDSTFFTKVGQLARTIRQVYPRTEVAVLNEGPTYVADSFGAIRESRHISGILRRNIYDFSDEDSVNLDSFLKKVHTSMLIEVKIGGSIHDVVQREGGKAYLTEILLPIKELRDQGYNIVVTTGGGPVNDGTKAYFRDEPDTDLAWEEARENLDRNAKRLLGAFNDLGMETGVDVKYYSIEEYHHLKTRMPSASGPMPIVVLMDQENPRFSDNHTIRIAHDLGARWVYFAKDVPDKGIHLYDPNMTPGLLTESTSMIPGADLQRLKELVDKGVNQSYVVLTVSDVKDGAIMTAGMDYDGPTSYVTPGHLAEQESLDTLSASNVVRGIGIFNGNNPDLMKQAIMREESVGSYIVADRYLGLTFPGGA